jgi:hypothetical protein
MSITERMENDGLSFGDAAAKESLVVGAPMQSLIVRLRDTAVYSDREGWTRSAKLLREAAGHIEALERRFAEHLEAWKANNAHHAARIDELEKQLREKPEIDRRLLAGRILETLLRVLYEQKFGQLDYLSMSAMEAQAIAKEAPHFMVAHYRNDPAFHAQVDRAVALVLSEIPR